MTNILTFNVKTVNNKTENRFGKWLGKIIDDSGLKKGKIAEKAGIKPGSLSRHLSGETGVAKKTAISLMTAINELSGKNLCDIQLGLGLIFGVNPSSSSALLESIRAELHGTEKWKPEQNEEFLQVVRITVAGINAKTDQIKKLDLDLPKQDEAKKGSKRNLSRPDLRKEMEDNLKTEIGKDKDKDKKVA